MENDPRPVQEDRSAARLLVPAVVAGVAAAIVGGIVWGLIVKWTDYEVGVAAWGIGFLVAFAILLATRRSHGLPLQLVAVACALLGILIGKYLSFVWVLEDVAERELPGAVDVPVFSRDTVDLFTDELGTVFSWIDLLWVGLAVYTAWRTLQPPEPETEPEPAVAPGERRP